MKGQDDDAGAGHVEFPNPGAHARARVLESEKLDRPCRPLRSFG